MATCPRCNGSRPRPCSHVDLTREVYKAIMPALKYVARRCGYALAVHGSLRTDIDLLAVPWRDSAISANSLAEEIRKTAEQIHGMAEARQKEPTAKPCGRLAWSFYLQPIGVDGPYIDLSVMQPAAAQLTEQKGEG